MESIVFALSLLVILLIGMPIALIVLFVSSRDKHRQLQQQIDRLREQMVELQQPPAEEEPSPATATSEPVESAAPTVQTEVEPDAEPEPVPEAQADPEPAAAVAAASMAPAAASVAVEAEEPKRGKNPVDHFEDLLRRGSDVVMGYFTDGNLFVRIGLLVLFCGVAFLLKFAAESDAIPLEVRFMAAAVGGIGLMLFGWRLRHSKPVYGLLLQGGGVGITYITIFTAFRLAHLIPSTLTFALLVLFAALTIALAILQNSRALAVYALVGGFLAPLLASTGSGNYVGLFSYYAVLNAAVFGIAWFREVQTRRIIRVLFVQDFHVSFLGI